MNAGLKCLFDKFDIAVGRLFNLLVDFFHSPSGQLGTRLLSIVLLHITSTLSSHPYGRSIGALGMWRFLVLLVLSGIADSCLLLLQLLLSKIITYLSLIIIFVVNRTVTISLFKYMTGWFL